MEGNRNSTEDTIRVYKALKDNIMRTLKVCTIGRVTDGTGDYVTCQLINKPKTFIECYNASDEQLVVDEIVIILFTDEDTRDNLVRIKNNEEPVEVEDNKLKHNLNYGIVIKKITINQEER